MSRRDQILQAFTDDDRPALDRLGWIEIWEACNTWWSPRQTATSREMRPFAKLLGDEDPAAILAALKALAGEWRPTPAAIAGHLHLPAGDDVKVDVGRGGAPFLKAAAIDATALELAAGVHECECGYSPSRYRFDAAFVWHCRDCGGLEPGQVQAAEDRAA